MEPLTMGLIAGGLQGVSAIGNFFGGRQKARAENQARARQFKQQLKIQQRQYEDQLIRYNTGVQQYGQQINEIDRAAALGYSREQLQQNEAFKQAMFGRQDSSIQLARMTGRTAGRGVSGKSAGRMENDNLAAFGRNQAKMAESLYSGQLRYGQNVQDIRNRQQSATNRAYSKIAIAPRKPVKLLAPYQSSGPSGFSLMAGLADAGLTGLSTYNQLNAPDPLK